MRFDVDARELQEVPPHVQFIFADQVPYATALAVTQTAKDFQEAQRERMDDIFTIRRPGFMRRSVKITEFAKKEMPQPQARVRIDPPQGRKSPADRSDIFGKFETDRRKDPLGGSVAVPTEHVPRTGTGVVRAAWRPRRVLDRNFRDDFRAFIKKSGGRRAIYFSERGERILPLYWLVPSVPITPNLEFVDTAKKTVDERWRDNFTRAFDRAIGLRRRF